MAVRLLLSGARDVPEYPVPLQLLRQMNADVHLFYICRRRTERRSRKTGGSRSDRHSPLFSLF